MKPKKIYINNVWSKNYLVQKILATDDKKKLILFLKKQNLIKYDLIKKNLSLNYNKKLPVGFVLKNKSKIVGFLGTLFSYRFVKKKKFLFCNIHSWLVESKHRFVSQLLFKNILKGCVTTVLTARPGLTKSFKRMGFKQLFLKYRITLLLSLNFFFFQNYLRIISDEKSVLKKLDKKNKDIFYKHKNKIFLQFIIYTDNNEYSFFICKLVKKKKYINILNIIYTSNTRFVKKYWNYIQVIIIKKYKILFCGNYFLKNSDTIIPRKGLFTKDFNKEIFIKNTPKSYSFNSLFSEYDF